MTTPLPSTNAARILEVLSARDGIATEVELRDGTRIVVYNIAWGQDFENPEYHITSNVSPSLPGAASDFFFTQDVVAMRDVASGISL